MVDRRAVVRGVEILVIAAFVALVVGQLLGQPVLLSYVETGSMAPTLQPGDGFIAVPAAVAGPIETGDVVVFRSERRDGLVTHRVVGTTPDGYYVTKGDANPFTDQSGGEPPVHEAQIVATALQVGGRVVVIPYLGVAVLVANDILGTTQEVLAQVFQTRALLGTQGLAYLLFSLGLLAYLTSLLVEQRESDRRSRQRDREVEVIDARTVVVSLTVLLVVVVSASMLLSGGTHQFEVVSSSNDAPGPRVIETGSTETVEFVVPSNGIIPVVVFLEPAGDGIDVSPDQVYVPGGSEKSVTVSLTASSETGRSVRFINEHRYLALLPQGTIRTLYGIHPWLPVLAIDALVGGGFAGIGAALLGTGRVRIRPKRKLPLRTRIERWFR